MEMKKNSYTLVYVTIAILWAFMIIFLIVIPAAPVPGPKGPEGPPGTVVGPPGEALTGTPVNINQKYNYQLPEINPSALIFRDASNVLSYASPDQNQRYLYIDNIVHGTEFNFSNYSSKDKTVCVKCSGNGNTCNDYGTCSDGTKPLFEVQEPIISAMTNNKISLSDKNRLLNYSTVLVENQK